MAEAVIVTIARCGLCAAENLPAQIVGRVVRRPLGIMVWISKPRSVLVGATVLAHPLLSHPPVPDRLHAVCKRHGEGTVSTADVISKRDTVIIDFTASA
jgi:hypothetical protein